MSRFQAHLEQALASIRSQDLFRSLRRIQSAPGRSIRLHDRIIVNFSSNDYLGLATHPALIGAATAATREFGAGSTASRLISGSLQPHHQLEETLAAFKRTEAALAFSSGYATALGVICALVGKDDFILLDKLVHASIVDAARLSGAKLRIFDHNDLADLESKLAWAAEKRGSSPNQIPPLILVVTESVFSMDGHTPPLAEIVQLKNKHGAALMVDEAHAIGVFGREGRGLADHLGVAAEIEIQMGTLGKALGSSGGYICGSRSLIELLVNRARSFIFSTAPTPASSAAANAALAILQTEEGAALRNNLWANIASLRDSFPAARDASSPIIPILIGEELKAVQVSQRLMEAGIFIPAIRFPTVARGEARLRLTVSAAHTAQDIEQVTSLLTSFTT